MVNGGNPFLAGVGGIYSAYIGGKAFGNMIVQGINSRFSMTTGQAAYYTVAQFRS